MELTQRTLQVLDNFSSINKGLKFSPGDTIRTRSVTGAIIAEAKLDTLVDMEFGIYNLSRFLGTISLFKKPLIELQPDRAVIGDGNTSIEYVFADHTKLLTPTEGHRLPPQLFQTVLTWDRIKEVTKAAKILGLSSIAFVDEGSGLFLKALDPERKVKDSYNLKLGESTGRLFSCILKLDNLKLIQAEYSVEVGWKPGEDGGKGRGMSRWTGIDFPVNYFILLDRASSAHA